MNIRKITQEFKDRTVELYGKKLKKIILYGSYARNRAHKDSDIDLLIVLSGKIIPGKEIDRLIDLITDINLKYGVLLSIYPVSEKNFSSTNSPLLINARREGILI